MKSFQPDQKMVCAVSRQALEPFGREPDAVGLSAWGTAEDRLDMTTLLMGMAGKDQPRSLAVDAMKSWRQEIACEKLLDGVRLKLANSVI